MLRAILVLLVSIVVIVILKCWQDQERVPNVTEPSGTKNAMNPADAEAQKATSPSPIVAQREQMRGQRDQEDSSCTIEDYFPSNVGVTWTYEITVGDTEPIHYGTILWPLGNRSIGVEDKGRFEHVANGKGRKRFKLVVRSKASAMKQGPLQYPKGVELEVVQDGLGVFENTKRVFLAINSAERFMAELIITYDPNDPMSTWRRLPDGATGGKVGDGFSRRLLFFGAQPGTALAMGKEHADMLYFVGSDASVEGYAGQALLHFKRIVKGTTDELTGLLSQPQNENALNAMRSMKGTTGVDPDVIYFSRGFEDDMWYAKGKGLVRLVQKVGEKTSMTWKLIALSKN